MSQLPAESKAALFDHLLRLVGEVEQTLEHEMGKAGVDVARLQRWAATKELAAVFDVLTIGGLTPRALANLAGALVQLGETGKGSGPLQPPEGPANRPQAPPEVKFGQGYIIAALEGWAELGGRPLQEAFDWASAILIGEGWEVTPATVRDWRKAARAGGRRNPVADGYQAMRSFLNAEAPQPADALEGHVRAAARRRRQAVGG